MKKSKFVNIVRSDSAYIVHSSLYNSIIKVNQPELKQFIDKIDSGEPFEYDENDELQVALKELKMIVDEKINENNIVNYYAQQRPHERLQIIMIVTRQCNFRCPYCYQEHAENKAMTTDLLNQVCQAIISKVNGEGFKEVEIAWFGGEPTLELKKIFTFMEQLKKLLPANVSLTGQMTTNAYLLNINNLHKLVNLGITRYQITIDGLAETHNTTRVLEKNLPTWDTIIKNLTDAQKSNLKFNFTIRTNFTEKIVKNSRKWFQYLKDNFSIDNRFTFYFEAVKNLGGELKDYIIDYPDKDSIEASSELMEVAKDVGLEFKPFYKRISPFGLRCYAADMNSYTIDYDGTIKKCTVCFDRPKNAVGVVKDGEFCVDEGKLSWWTSYYHEKECQDCSIYPSCYAEKCPNGYFDQTACEIYKGLYNDTLKMFL